MDFSNIFATFTALTDPDLSSREQKVARKRQESESSDDKGKLTEKDFYTLLKDAEGLPNELDAIAQELQQITQFDMLHGSDNVELLATRYVSLVNKLKKLKFNQKEYEKAKETVISNEAQDDYAIDRYGNLLLFDRENPGQITRMNYKEWMKNYREDGNYMPLTNGNLLWYRYTSPTEVGDNALYSITDNGIGLTKINKLIKDSFTSIGTTESENDSLVSTYIKQGVKEIQQLLSQGPEGYYKFTSKMKGPDREKLMSVFQYIYSVLPRNAKIRLALETKNGTENEVAELIFNNLLGQTAISQGMAFSYLGSEEKTSGKSNNDYDISKVNSNQALIWYSGMGQYADYTITRGGKRNMQVHSPIGKLTDSQDKNLGVNASLRDVSAGTYASVLDFGNATMGDKLINKNLYDLVLTDGQIASIDFPCYTDENGVLKPQLDQKTWNAIDNANMKIRKLGIDINNAKDRKTHYRQINNIYKEFGLEAPYDANGNIAAETWHRFGVINARTTEKALNMEKSEANDLLTPETNEAAINKYIEIAKDSGWDKGGIFSSSDSVLYGTIWIPMYNNGAGLASGANMGTIVNMDKQYQANEIKQNQYITPPSVK